MPKILSLKKLFAAIFISLGLSLAPVFNNFAHAATSYFESFTGDYYLEKDTNGGSVLRVVETIVAKFPEDSGEHGITRQLIYTGTSDVENSKTLDLKATRNGNPENIAMIELETIHTYDGDAHYFDIRIGNANQEVSGRQTYTLEYTYHNVINELPDLDDLQELYWNANGTGWSKPIDEVVARVHFGKDIENKFTYDTACFVGKYGETGEDRCKTRKITDGIEFYTVGKSLSAGENLTFAVGIEPGTFKINDQGYTLDTKIYNDYRVTSLTIIAILIGGVLLLLTFIAYHQNDEKRKYYQSYFIKPEYTPPHDLLVAEMAENYIGATGGDRKVATLIELAVNHQIELIKNEKETKFGKKKVTWQIQIKTDKLKKSQAIVLKILAGSNTPLSVNQKITVKSHTATKELTELASDFETTLNKRLIEKGYLEGKVSETDSSVQKSHSLRLSSINSVLGAVWIIGWIGALLLSFSEDAMPNYLVMADWFLLPVLIIVLIAVPIIVIRYNIKISNIDKHTMKGLEYSRYMDGLKMYIKMAEADRLKMLQSVEGADTSNAGVVKIYEKLLPYAIIFRMEKTWLQELSHYYELTDVGAPIWFVGMGTFSTREFTSAMHSISTTTSSAIISSSTSTSSGGGGSFGGGGFSGGGGGGGGGGTW